MKKLIVVILALALPLLTVARGGDVLDSMNSPAFWTHLSYTDYTALHSTPRIPEADVMMVVASNRMPQWGKEKFMGEERATDHLTYFVAFQKDGKWNLWRMSLKAAIASMQDPNRDWVVYTEGYGKVFTNGLYRGFSMAAQHKVNVLYLDYPSYNTAKKVLGNFYFSLDNAKMAGDDFAPVLDTVKSLREAGKMGNGHLTLFFHSMGNNVLCEIVRRNHLKDMNNDVWVDNLVLNSACVPESKHFLWIDQIKFAKQIYVNYNPKDATLGGAAMVSLTRQLGQGPRVVASKKAAYINFNRQCGMNHSNFIVLEKHSKANASVMAYYNVILHGNAVPLEDKKLFANSSFHNMGYDFICDSPTGMKCKNASEESQVINNADTIPYPEDQRYNEVQQSASMTGH